MRRETFHPNFSSNTCHGISQRQSEVSVTPLPTIAPRVTDYQLREEVMVMSPMHESPLHDGMWCGC